MAGADWLTPEEAARELRITRRTVYQWLRSGKLRGRKVGGAWRVPASAVRAGGVAEDRPEPPRSDRRAALARLMDALPELRQDQAVAFDHPELGPLFATIADGWRRMTEEERRVWMATLGAIADRAEQLLQHTTEEE